MFYNEWQHVKQQHKCIKRILTTKYQSYKGISSLLPLRHFTTAGGSREDYLTTTFEPKLCKFEKTLELVSTRLSPMLIWQLTQMKGKIDAIETHFANEKACH